MSEETKTEETTQETKVRKPRTNTNPKNLPSPTPAEFLFYWNETAKSGGERKDAVKRMQDAGFHMTYQALTQRVRQYSEIDGISELMDEVKRGSAKKNNVETIKSELEGLVAASKAKQIQTMLNN